MNRIESAILCNLIQDEEYLRKTFPYLESAYFQEYNERLLFNLIKEYIDEYKTNPSKDELSTMLSNSDNITEDNYNEIDTMISNLNGSYKLEWSVDETEKFCQKQAVYNAIMDSIKIIDDTSDDIRGENDIPGILTDALSVTFDPNIGHDFFDDSDQRFDYYHTKESKIPFDLHNFNEITSGGISNKSLNIILAGTGVGKSLFMCHCAAANLNAGYNVLYITLEMAEERIAERIDANLLSVPIVDLPSITKTEYDSKLGKAFKVMETNAKDNERESGKLIVKEYPTATAHTGHFRHLLNELSMKKKFKPDVIYVDYINICSSARITKFNENVNSYTYVKSIAEELRGLAVEMDVPIMSATQLNRSGFADSDPDLTNTSESFGLPATADLMIALITNEELEEQNQIKVKQLKNRYNDPTYLRAFIIGVDRGKMRLYDVEQDAQNDIISMNTIGKETDEDTTFYEGFKL